MLLTNGDLFALMIALFSSVSVITLSFRRIAVLEKQASDYRRKIRKAGI